MDEHGVLIMSSMAVCILFFFLVSIFKTQPVVSFFLVDFTIWRVNTRVSN